MAEALRRLHDSGQIHGGVSPASVTLGADGVELTPTVHSGEPTPYTAPEVIAGKPGDVASDIFSYGAVLYEMLTGQRAFDGADSAAIAAAVTQARPAPADMPAMGRLVAACLAKDPAARPRRMQKLVLELKILSMAAQRAEQPGAPRDTALVASLRSEIAQLEARLNQRLESDRQGVAQSHRDTQQHLDATAEYIQGLERNLTASQVRVRKLEESGLNRGDLDRIGLNLEAHAGRMQELEATIAAAHGAIEHLDRNAANREQVHLIAQIVESEQERIENIEVTLASIVSAFQRQTEPAVDHEQLAPIAQHVEAQSACMDGAEKTAEANAESQTADFKSAVTRTVPAEAPTHGNIGQGLVYGRVPHITLKSIANNAEIDIITDKFQQTLKPLREQLNAALQQNWEEWQIPREADDKWSEKAKRLHSDWRQQRIARQKEIDASIAANAGYECLYDTPYEDPKTVRVGRPLRTHSECQPKPKVSDSGNAEED
ncbi:MAG: protein kinase [Bryobacteraceae bacterium]